jgi:VWFA-related protein
MLHAFPVRPQVPARLALVLLPFLLSFSTYSQTEPPPAAAAAPGAAVANPLEVTVELTVHDKKGGAVPDLTPADLEVFDAGALVPLTGLRLAGNTEESVAFVFDRVEAGIAKTDRDVASQFLAAAEGHGYHFAVFKIEGRLHLVQAPTTDVEAVKVAIQAVTMAKRPDYLKVTEAAEKQLTDDIDSAAGQRQATAKMLMAMLIDSQKTATAAQFTPSVAALLALSRSQWDAPGRKAILYFSQGLDWNKSSPELLRDIRDAANRAHASIYSFDAEAQDTAAAQSMIAGSAVAASRQMGSIPSGPLTQGAGPTAQEVGPGAGSESNEYVGRLESGEGALNSLKSLAGVCRSTGGAHVLVNDGKRAANEIAMDLNSYYLASWISPSSGDESKLRPIGVKPLRKGLLVSTRAGYFPQRGGNVASVSAAETKLLAALAAPELPAALPLSAALLRYGNTPDNDLNSVLVQVPLDQLETQGHQGGVSVLVQLKDQSGAVVHKFSADVAPRQAGGEPGEVGPEIVSFRRQFSAPPGEYVMETAAMEASGGKTGAQRANVEIPAVAKGLALGDVLLVRRIDPAGSSEAADPLRCAKGIVVPNLSAHIAKTGTAKIDLFFDVHPDPGAVDAPILSAELRHDDELVGKLPLKLNVDPERKTIPYLTTLSAGSLSAGEYEMKVILSQGGKTVSRTLSFTLE